MVLFDTSIFIYTFASLNTSDIIDMNIQAKIKQQGFTIAQVAAQMKKKSGGVGISQGSLSTMLNGNPTIDKLKEIADIIGLTLSELVAEEGSRKMLTACPYCGKPIKITIEKTED